MPPEMNTVSNRRILDLSVPPPSSWWRSHHSGPAQFPIPELDSTTVTSFVDKVAKSIEILPLQLAAHGIAVPPLPIIIEERKALVDNEDLINVTKAGYEFFLKLQSSPEDTSLAWQQLGALDAILAGKDSLWTPEVKKFVASLWDEASLMWVREVIRLANGIE